MSIGSTDNNLTLDGNLTVAGEHDFVTADGKLIPPQGAAFPATTTAGELFWRTDERILYRRSDANDAWEAVKVDEGALIPGIVGVVLVKSDGTKERYSTITAALAVASAGDVVGLGPGTYAESFSVPAGVEVRGAYGGGVSIISGSSATGTRVTLGAQSVLAATSVTIPTDATPAISIPSGSLYAVVSEPVLLGQGGVGVGIRAEFPCVIDRVRYASGTCDTVVDAATTFGAVLVNGLVTFSGNVQSVLKVRNGGQLVATTVYSNNAPGSTCVNGVLVEDGSLVLSDSNIVGCTNGVRVASDSAALDFRSVGIDFCDTDLLADSGITAAVARFTGCKLSVDSIVAPSAWLGSGKVTLTFQDDKVDDEGFKIFGELQVGLPEKGRESVFGEGDSYTRGSIVLTTDGTADATTDGGNLTDVTASAASPVSSTFSFQGITAGHSILFASTLLGADDRLKFYGIKVKQAAAAVLNLAGSHDTFIFEVWDGSAWAEVDSLATESSQFHAYANEVFIRANSSEHIRLGANTKTTWAKKTINGQEAYWARVRIAADVLTAPVFEQFKLSPSRVELNADGTITMHGDARFRTSTIFAGNVWGESGGVGSISPSVGSGGNPTGWDHNIKNSFLNTNGDAVYTQFPLPFATCTSCPLFMRFSLGATDTASDVGLICSVLPVEQVGVMEADESGGIEPVPRSAANTQALTAKPALTDFKVVELQADKLTVVEFGPFSIADYYAGDQVLIRLELDDDGVSNVNVLAYSLSAVGVSWTLGEHI